MLISMLCIRKCYLGPYKRLGTTLYPLKKELRVIAPLRARLS
uniref:Uncharacterized protein n=1 Tax=Lepeophtheirus salmonis TaxID=72036 RepID=A0A0K2UXT9_LEPSM